MAIVIVKDTADVYVTQSEYNRLYAEYCKYVRGTAVAPSFEEYVRSHVRDYESPQQRIHEGQWLPPTSTTCGPM